jgi:hypothetical protein
MARALFKAPSVSWVYRESSFRASLFKLGSRTGHPALRMGHRCAWLHTPTLHPALP